MRFQREATTLSQETQELAFYPAEWQSQDLNLDPVRPTGSTEGGCIQVLLEGLQTPQFCDLCSWCLQTDRPQDRGGRSSGAAPLTPIPA